MIHVVALVASSMLLAAGAQAQTPCDQLKAVLAARIDAAGARGYSLEAVPAGTPVPAGAKVIGTCEGGASKILYRREAAARPAPRPVSPSNEAAASAVAPAPGNGSQAAMVRDVDHAAAQPQPTPPDKPAATKHPPAQEASRFIAEHWRWIGALVFVSLAAAIWVWHAYFSAYDKAGLPRGRRRGTAQHAALRLRALQMRRGLDHPESVDGSQADAITSRPTPPGSRH
jgi:hypothetical protein